jgi:hypothetical protein
MNTPTADDRRFARLCGRGGLDRVQIHAGCSLTVSGHLLDPDLGDLELQLRFGPGVRPQADAGGPRGRDAGIRKWISLNGVEAPLLSDDASTVLGYGEFPALRSESSRELVNEAIQALSSIWDEATKQVDYDTNRHIPPAESVTRLNRIAREEDPVGAWEQLLKDLLVRGPGRNATVAGLRFESAQGLALPNHFHKVNVYLRFAPPGSDALVNAAAIWRDAGEGTARLEVGLSDSPCTVRYDRRRQRHPAHGDPASAKAIQVASEWLAAIEHAAHEFVFNETFPVVQRIAEATFEGHAPGGPEVVWCRAEGVRSSALAHLNQWVREVYTSC